MLSHATRNDSRAFRLRMRIIKTYTGYIGTLSNLGMQL
jgi:hypothetical protein